VLGRDDLSSAFEGVVWHFLNSVRDRSGAVCAARRFPAASAMPRRPLPVELVRTGGESIGLHTCGGTQPAHAVDVIRGARGGAQTGSAFADIDRDSASGPLDHAARSARVAGPGALPAPVVGSDARSQGGKRVAGGDVDLRVFEAFQRILQCMNDAH